jgi:hypothetical protein
MKTTAVFLDMTAAFDKVWKDKLITISHELGINGKLLIWVNDFLRNRKIKVRFNDNTSKEKKMHAGVPQGSVISPLLFLIYTANISKNTKDTKLGCYADDISIWYTSKNVRETEININKSLIGIENWANERKLQINPSKTNLTVFTTDRRNKENFTPIIKLNETIIEKTENPKYLGVILDKELRFTRHRTTNIQSI